MRKNWTRYPICPECKKDTIVLFTPPKEPIDFSKLGKPDYIDWEKAHLYCCNGQSNCKFSPRLFDLVTPQRKKI